MRLYLIRHGESLYNSQNRIQGQTDIALSELGVKQAEAIAIGFDAVYSSPLERAYRTAVPLATRQGLPIQTMDQLKEINAGVFSGLLWSEVETKFPEYAKPWHEQHFDFVIPQGESRKQLQTRGMAALTEIANTNQECVAVVAHGGVLCAALKGLLGIRPELNPFSLFNGSISRLFWNGTWQLVTLNQMEHLISAGVAKEAGRGNL
jgi:broad specificity phosphatase PhoE